MKINTKRQSLYKNANVVFVPVVTKHKFIYKHTTNEIHQWEYTNGKIVLSIWKMPDTTALNLIRTEKVDYKNFFVSSAYKEPWEFEESISDQINLGKIYLSNRSITLAFKWFNRIEKLFNKHNAIKNYTMLMPDNMQKHDEVSYRQEVKSTCVPDIKFTNENEIPYLSKVELSRQELRSRKQKMLERAYDRAHEAAPVLARKMHKRIEQLNRIEA